jgi:hypothetical protein
LESRKIEGNAWPEFVCVVKFVAKFVTKTVVKLIECLPNKWPIDWGAIVNCIPLDYLSFHMSLPLSVRFLYLSALYLLTPSLSISFSRTCNTISPARAASNDEARSTAQCAIDTRWSSPRL